MPTEPVQRFAHRRALPFFDVEIRLLGGPYRLLVGVVEDATTESNEAFDQSIENADLLRVLLVRGWPENIGSLALPLAGIIFARQIGSEKSSLLSCKDRAECSCAVFWEDEARVAKGGAGVLPNISFSDKRASFADFVDVRQEHD